jgi:cytochrome c peroxidase
VAPLSLKRDLAGPARLALLASCLSAAVALAQERVELAAGTGQSQAAAHAADDRLARARLIARGEDLFFNETFNGNGRTCGTCHPVENNFTLDPGFIATLKRNDPLFVAERNPALADLENPRLLREFGLIRENVDGFQNPAVLRGVPHVLSLSTSVASISGPQTGWSGDGAPGDRTLRSFATGAVIQHFTKTLQRVPGVDFRLPTEAELDALLAFQQSLGRQSDPVLPLPLKGTVPRRGQDIFLDNTLGKCNLCHVNAGANATLGAGNLGNIRVDIGVEALLDSPAGLTGEAVPPDGGFGVSPNPNPQLGFGDGSFNIPPLVEAADTPPFFHNNAIATLEGAVAFYNSDAFNNSRGARQIGGGIHLDTTQVEAVAAFLRVINALENIDSAIRLQRSALRSRNEARRARFVARSAGEIEDAIEVLAGARLHPDAVTLLDKARSSVTGCEPCSNKTIRKAIRRERTARGRIAA